jgi:hypothetical protein
VYVVFGDVGQLKINDLRKLIDIEAASRDIGSDQYGNLTLFEIV